MEKFTPLATNFTLPPGLTGWTNFTSGEEIVDVHPKFVLVPHLGILDVVDSLKEGVSDVCIGFLRFAFEKEQFS